MSENQQTDVEETYADAQDTSEENYQEEQPEVSELSSLKQELQELKGLNQKLLSTLTPQEKKASELTTEQIAQMQQNPALMAQWLKAQADSAVGKIQSETRKQVYDQKAYKEFPALETNKQFETAVLGQMKEFISTGEYSAENPMLLYRAAQIVAGKMNVKRNNPTRSADLPTSEAPQSRTVRSPSGQRSPTISDNDPKIQFLKAFGITDPKKIEQFKKQLPEMTTIQTPRTRRIGR